MPTYEAVVAILILFVMRAVTRLSRPLGAAVAGVLAAGCLYATVAWGVYFGGPVILAGAAIGFLWGWASLARQVRHMQETATRRT